ncbi:MAG TPA: glycoside hydrolase [Cyanothece sp. UBA12306]|nr:glycoside hydrolase [Cyanothece sp. UBA12306]
MMLYKLLSRINIDRFEPVVISLIDGGPLAEQISALDIPVYSIAMNSRKVTIQGIWRLINLVWQIKPDVIQGWMYHGNLVAQILSILSFKPVPVIWNIRHSVYSLEYEKPRTATIIKLLAKLSSFPKTIIYVSQTSVNQHEQLGYKASKSVMIPNGFNTDVFIPSTDARQKLRQELGLTENALIIGLIARYHPMKDHANFLKAAAILLKEIPDVYFLLVGTGLEEENPNFVALLTDLNLTNEKNFYFLGERQDIPYITAGLDISSLVSAWGEGFPNVIGEAMACGIPCVVTDVGDSASIVGDTGKIVPPKQPELLAKAWQELIELGVENRKNLSQKARRRIIELFSLELIVNRYEMLYDQCQE